MFQVFVKPKSGRLPDETNALAADGEWYCTLSFMLAWKIADYLA
jgi:hypothetical protein